MITQLIIDKFYEDYPKLGLLRPNAAIAKATGYSRGNVSAYLNKVKMPSENFIKAFYRAFESSLTVPQEIQQANHVNIPEQVDPMANKMLAQSILNLTETNKRLAEQGEVNSKTLSRLVDRLLELGSTEFQAFLFGGNEDSKAPTEYLRKKDKSLKTDIPHK